MTRCKTWTAIVALLIVATALPLLAAPPRAEASTLRGRLRNARLELRDARQHLAMARAALRSALLTAPATTDPTLTPDPTGITDPTATPEPSSTPVPVEPSATPTPLPEPSATPEPTPAPSPTATAPAPTIEELRARVAKWRRVTRRWQRTVDRLARQYRLQRQLAAWERAGDWRPIIEVAAGKYGVSADGVYRMMMHESGGKRFAGSSSPFKGLFQYYTGTWSASWNPWRGDSIYDGSSQIWATCYAVHKGLGPSMWTSTYASAF